MLSQELEEKLRASKLALDKATSEDIIELCKRYLTLLAEYRIELYRLPDTLDLNPRSRFATSLEGRATRKKVRAAIERTTSEREWAERLIISFNAVNGYGAVETFNRQKYKGRDDWKLSAGGVSFSDGGLRMAIQEAVETASLLRREEHVAKNADTVVASVTLLPPS